jgi:hypothetical protein
MSCHPGREDQQDGVAGLGVAHPLAEPGDGRRGALTRVGQVQVRIECGSGNPRSMLT